LHSDITGMTKMDCCDNCKYYDWYYDWCDKWKCKVDTRKIHNCFEKYDTPIYDMMVGVERKDNDWKQDNWEI